MKTMIITAAALLLLHGPAWAEQGWPPAAPVSPLAPAISTQTAASAADAQIAPGQWDVERVRCATLLGAADDDRASAAMFYYGYLAAKAGIRVVDVSKIEGNIGKAMQQCAAKPQMTVPQAFRTALAPRK